MNTRRTLRSNTSTSGNNAVQSTTKKKSSTLRKSPKRQYESDDSQGSSSDNLDDTVITVVHKSKPKNKKCSPPKRLHKVDENSSDFENKNKSKSPKRKHESDDGSSSDSSVGDYLKTADEIDLNSSFFTSNAAEKPPDFDSIEKKIFGGIQRLSESESEEENINSEELTTEENISTQNESSQSDEKPKTNFSQLREYNKKIEEAKACVQKYESSKKVPKKPKTNKNDEISTLLTLGETKLESQNSVNSFESDSDDEDEMDWQEIEIQNEKNEDKINIPKEGVQITVELPTLVRKKSKGIDMMTAIKRRMNRIKKENQVYVHKVHLLCWIAYGNFVNSVLNDEELLGCALSLIPSDKCYPPKHADMSYLEQIVKWYGKMMKLNEIKNDQLVPLKDTLKIQIKKKQALSKRDFVLAFILILRSLGLQCRLILSFQCVPLRPDSSELLPLTTKEKTKDTKTETSKSENQPTTSKSKSNKSTSNVSKTANPLNKSISNTKSNKTKKSETNSKSTKKGKTSEKTEKQTKNTSKSTNKNIPIISQVDGADDSDNEPSTSKPKNKPNIKIKLKKNLNESISSLDLCLTKAQRRRKSEISKTPDKNLLNPDTDADFKPRSKSLGKSPKDINGNKKSSSKLNENKTELKTTRTRKSTSGSSKEETKNISKDKTPVSSNTKLVSSDKNKRDTSKSPRIANKKDNLKTSKDVPKKTTPKSSKVDNKAATSKVNSPEKIKIKTEKNIKSPNTSSSYFSNDEKPKLGVAKDIMNLIKGEMTTKRNAELQRKVKKDIKKEDPEYDSDYFPDEDEEVEKPVLKRKSIKKYESDDDFKFKVNTNVKRKIKAKEDIDTRVISSDDEIENQDKKKKIGNDVWAEVFLEEEEKWISVDLIKGQIHCVAELHSRATQPVSYIVAWNNNLSLKDVTARYCPNWNTVTRKLRVDSSWWNASLRPFLGVKTARDKEEDEDLARQQLDKPLPTTISEYKNHPLYALKRHLLKFEAIYPPDALTLGFVRNEPVYARECVHTLHSREIWVKHAKVVKPAQQPYKIVKARPKYDKLTGNVITDLPLELFGSWQVEDYVPPTAENGIVPRNPYGNVELFKACMLPKKTVHLQLPGLNKIARKLQIDCAPAVVGFDFHGGYSHPMFDGYVVCEEFKDVLIKAWEEDQAETARKEMEKYEKRVWGNWRKLIKAVLIRERLKARYDFGNVETTNKGKKKSKNPKVVLKKRKICSDDDDQWTDIE